MARITGTAARNRLVGTSSRDTILGLGGDDQLFGRAGNDLLAGGSGNDRLYGGSGNDTLRGGSGNDVYVLNSLDDSVDEQDNSGSADWVVSAVSVSLNTLASGALEHALLTGKANSIAVGNHASNILRGNSGENVLVGAGGDDLIYGRGNNDIVFGGDGVDCIIGGAGRDAITGGPGNDLIYGGAGNDVILHSGLAGDGDDTIFFNGGGYDTIRITTADFYDIVLSRDGDDLIVGGTQDDTYSVQATITVVGFYSQGFDLKVFIDTLFNNFYGNDSSCAHIHFTADVTRGINNVNATEFLVGHSSGNDIINGNGGRRDFLYGQGGDDILNGGNGVDYLFGEKGDDVLNGGDGNDELVGGNGRDAFDGGSGIDFMNFRSESIIKGVIVDLSSGTIFNDGFGNVESVKNVEDVAGTHLADTIVGDNKDNWLHGYSANDTLNGMTGSDILIGGSGDDTLIGGDGRDWLIGLDGNDTLTGGQGGDAFFLDAFGGINTVTDFDTASDGLDLSFILEFNMPAEFLSDFIILDDSGLDTLVAFDFDGAPGGAVPIATLIGLDSANGCVVGTETGIYIFNSGTGEFERL